jgi:hypothetical protein
LKGFFYAKLICERDGVLTEIDSRTSDAIAVGVRFNSPIYTFSNVLEDAGITRDQEDAFESDSLISQDDTLELEEATSSYSSSSMDELEKQLQDALENEDYELASKLRDEIKKRDL